jgi:hypothetical protein
VPDCDDAPTLIRADLEGFGSPLPQTPFSRMGRWWRPAIPSAGRHRVPRMVRDMGRHPGQKAPSNKTEAAVMPAANFRQCVAIHFRFIRLATLP